MTLNDLKRMDCDILTPAIVAEIIGCDPQVIRITAKKNPDSLGFPVIRHGTRTKIPRLAFIRFMEGI